MPTRKLTFNPGVNTEATPSLNEQQWQSVNQIRWFGPTGLIQKLGGWQKYYNIAISSQVESMHAWEDLDAVTHLAIGATGGLYSLTNGSLATITPQLTTTNPAVSFTTTMSSDTVTITDASSATGPYDAINLETQVSVGGIVLYGAYATTQVNSTSYTIQSTTPATSGVTGGAVATFGTTSGSFIVLVTLANHGLAVGDTFPVAVPVSVGGLTISGFYTVLTYSSSSAFTIGANASANASVTVSQNGGDARIQYWRVPTPGLPGTGYGIGGYGSGPYGGTSQGASTPGTPITTANYSLDNWGSLLIANPQNGPIFSWDPTSGIGNAQMVAAAPTINEGCFVAMPAQILVAFGASVLGIQDPLLMDWSNDGDFTNWTPTVADQAGDFRLPRGSRIVGAGQGPQYAVVWTDIEVWSMSYIGAPLVFSFNTLGTGCGLISKFAWGDLGTSIFWMSQKQFFMLPSGGSVTPLPCSVWDFIFQQLDTTYVNSIKCGTNAQFSEIRWDFPVIGGGGVNTAYVKYNMLLNVWDSGFDTSIPVGRSAWIDQSVLGSPIGAGAKNNYIYQHETSNDADGQAMTPMGQTGWFTLSDGEDFMTVDALYPDMRFGYIGGPQNATVNATFTYAPYPQSPTNTTQNYVMQDVSIGGQPFYRPMVRGRVMSITFASNDVGTFWRAGGPRVRLAPDGQLG